MDEERGRSSLSCCLDFNDFGATVRHPERYDLARRMSPLLALAIGFPEPSTLTIADVDIARVEHWIEAVVEHLPEAPAAAAALR
jgi:hypothetical protein